MSYAKMLDVPFAYSSNGDAFYEHDFLTGMERQIALDEFPSYDKLVQRFKEESNGGQGISDEEMAIMTDVDDFDFICHVAYGKKPLTRRERAESVKKQDFFSRYSGAAKEVLEVLLDKYMNLGIYALIMTACRNNNVIFER